jgi:hypothetical protein
MRRKVATLKRKWMLEKIPIAAAKLASTSRIHSEKNLCGFGDMPRLAWTGRASF